MGYTYTTNELCAIIRDMVNDACKLERKSAAVAVFGIVYGEYIDGKDATAQAKRKTILAATEDSKGKKSSDQQLNYGRNVYNLLKDNPAALASVFDADSVTAPITHTDIKNEFNAIASTAAKDTNCAVRLVFGIQKSAKMRAAGLSKADMHNLDANDQVYLGNQIVDFLNNYPKYKVQIDPTTLIGVASTSKYALSYTDKLVKSKNIILRGAPGTGKTYLAKQIAAELVSDAAELDYEKLTPEQQERIGFVQFHPSYDYSDFVEGLRPIATAGGPLGFDLVDGVFKQFVNRAKADWKPVATISTATTDNELQVENASNQPEPEPQKNYVFIIDEINRGEISKIFGELFFSIDPGYRGESGGVFTQYANMHGGTPEKFYIPDNVYIIGTMNDIDRSVDTFDFAMRRRFRFIEVRADENMTMLEELGADYIEACERMSSLNDAILKVDGLNENYQIGASYFLKLAHLTVDELWEDFLKPLLQDYTRGMHDDTAILKELENAYFLRTAGDGTDEHVD